MDYGTKVSLVTIPLAIVGAVIPLPMIEIVLLYVILARPPWFSALVDQIYGRGLRAGSSGSTDGFDAP